jgi:hypothetical protein
MIIDNSKISLVNNFICEFKDLANPSASLNLKLTSPLLFSFDLNSELEIENLNFDFKSISNKFDLITGDIPFGMERIQLSDTVLVSVNRNWQIIYNALGLLNDNGNGIFMVEPTLWHSSNGKRVLDALENKGIYLNAIFKTPERLLLPMSAFQPIAVIFSRIKKDVLFIGEISDNNAQLLKNYFSNFSSDKLVSGIVLPKSKFESFNKFEIEMEIKSLKTQYKDYDTFQLKDVVKSINVTTENFVEVENALYIPKTFIDKDENTHLSIDLSSVTRKHINLFQIELNKDLITNEFLMLFYRSEIGRLVLKSLSNRSDFVAIRKQDLENSYIVIPKIAEQILLVKTDKKLDELQETIFSLKNELSLNPKNAHVILDKFESIQAPLRQLSEEDLILSLIRKGENKTIEFKESFFKNLRTGQKDQEIQKASLKNIVGFLNSDGGNLLVGVADDGTLSGIEDDFFVSLDKYKLNFKNALHSKIGAEYYPLIDFDIFSINGKLILKVECKPSSEPCFYDENEFYVRTNPATDKLEGKKQHEYIRERFIVKH